MSLDPSYGDSRRTPRKNPAGAVVTVILLALVIWLGWLAARNVIRGMGSSEVYDLLNRQRDAWNAGDLDGFMAGYWNDPELTFYSGGTVTKGWDATRRRYQARYKAEGREMGTLSFDDNELATTGPDLAVMRGRWKVVTSKESFEGLFTLLLRRIDGKWVIVHDHTSAADPPKPQ